MRILVNHVAQNKNYTSQFLSENVHLETKQTNEKQLMLRQINQSCTN